MSNRLFILAILIGLFFAVSASYGFQQTANAAVTVLEAHFDADAEGFTYVDDPFRGTSQPTYASGTWLSSGGLSGGGLEVTLGGIDNADIFGMSGGWQRSFSLTSPNSITLSFFYNLSHAGGYETDEYGEVIVTVDALQPGKGCRRKRE